MPFEDEFSHALREAADAEPPTPVMVLAMGAAQRGQRRKRRNTLLTSAAAVATATCVGLLAMQLSSISDAAGRNSEVTSAAAAPSGTEAALVPGAAPSASAAPTGARPSVASTASARTTSPTEVTADQFGSLFKSKLPANLQLSSPMATKGQHAPQLVSAYAAKDGDRNGAVEIDISKAGSHGPQATAGPCSHPVADCTTTTEADGSTLTVYLPAKDADGSQEWTAFLRRPDGGVVQVMASNLQPSADHPYQVYANAPMLDGTQLSAIALDPAWQPLITGLGGATAG